jgi:hypothetical protein
MTVDQCPSWTTTRKMPKTQFEEWVISDFFVPQFVAKMIASRSSLRLQKLAEFQKFHRVELMIAPKLTSTKPSVFTSPTFILN